MAKKAFVTGGGTGIGKGIAEVLIKNGYDVAVSYNSSSSGAEEILELAKSLGRKAVALKGNIADTKDIAKIFSEYRKSFGTLDLFVNNAGVTLKSRFLETSEEIFDSVCNVDFKGAFFCMQEAAKIMVENNTKGNMIVISSNNAKAHFADVSVYASVKTAVSKLSEHIAIELAQYGIRVNTVAPGWTDTGSSRLDDKESTYYKVPLKRWTTPEEIGKTVLFLDSDAALSITGTTITVDGGALLVSDKREKYGY